MMRKRCVTLCVLLFFCFIAHFARAHTCRISVMVDTDMALDDIRAIAIDYWIELDRRQIFDEFTEPVRYSLTW